MNIWPFKNKERITSDELATRLLKHMGWSGEEFCKELQEYADSKWPDFSSDETVTLGNEVVVAYLWMVSRFSPNDKKALDRLHDGHLAARVAEHFGEGGTDEQRRKFVDDEKAAIFLRYGKYYEAWNDKRKSNAGIAFALSSQMAQFFFPRRSPVNDQVLEKTIRVRVGAFMDCIIEFRESLKVTDS